MRWLITSALVVLLFSSVVADESQETGRTLTPEQAQEAIQDAAETLSFEHVASLTPEVAAILAKHKGELALYGLEVLSADAAKALAKHDGRLSLNSISSLPEDAALALAKHQGDLCMHGLAELHCEPLARRLLLARNRYWVGGDAGLNPDCLTSISPEVAELLVIATQDGDGLSLTELKSPSIDVLKVLARINGDLHLGIASLTPEMASVLATHKGGKLTVAVQDIEALRALMKHDGHFENALALHFPEVTPEIASVLATFEGTIYLPSGTLSGEVEKILAASDTAYFRVDPSVITTGDFAAKLVASLMLPNAPSEKIFWPKLQELSVAVAKELSVFPGVIVLPAVEKVSPDVANVLAEGKGRPVLPALRELTSVPLAKKLAETAITSYLVGDPDDSEPWGVRGKDGLRLPRLTRVTPDIARSLAAHNSELLALNGLLTITDEVAEALANFTGDLFLNGITELSARSEQLLGNGRCRFISVPQLRRLTDPAFAKKAFLNEIESVSVDALQSLVDKTQLDSMYLELQQLSPEQAAVLAKKQGRHARAIHLDSVQRLDAATARELASARMDISLGGLTELTPEVAAAFANNREVIYLRGVEAIPVEVAQALAKKTTGKIVFDGLHPHRGKSTFKSKDEPFALPEESAVLLRDHPHIRLPQCLQRP